MVQSKSVKYPNLTWTFSTMGCPERSLGECCELARRFGLSALELRALDDRIDLTQYFAECFDSPHLLKAFLEQRDISITCLNTSFKLIGSDQAEQEKLLEFVPWAEATQTPFLRVFDGGEAQSGLDQGQLQEASRMLKWWRSLRAEKGWRCDLGIETHDALVRARDCSRLIDAVDGNASIIWDSHHTWKKAGEDPAETWGKIGSHVVHVHVKDSISHPSTRHPFTYVDLGEGEFPLETTLDRLNDDKFAGCVSIEWERLWHPYLKTLDKTLEDARLLGWL